MAIVISRSGELSPQYQPLTPEQREAAWAHILKHWTDNNADSFRSMLKGSERRDTGEE